METQKVTLPFITGVNKTESDKLTPITSLLALDNGIFRRGSAIQKRFGFQSLGQNILTTTNEVDSGKKLTTFNNDLLLLNNTDIYSYTPSNNAWIDKGSFATITVENYPVIRNSATQTMPDVAYALGYSVCAWHDSRGSSSVRYSILDDTSRTAVVSDQVFITSANVRLPKVAGVDGFLFVFAIDGANLKLRRINLVDFTTSDLTVAADVDTTDPIYDIVVYSNRIALTYNNNAGGITVLYVIPDFNGVPVVGGPSTGSVSPVTFAADQGDRALTIAADVSTGRIYVAYCTTGNNVRVRGVRVDLASATSSVVTIHNIANVAQITGIVLASGILKLFYEVRDTTNPYLTLIYTAAATWDGGATAIAESGAEAVFKRSVGLVSKAFLNDGVAYVVAAHESTLQPTYFMFDSSGNVAAKTLAQTAGGLTKNPSGTYVTGLSQVSTNSDGDYFVGLLTRVAVQTEASVTLTTTGVVAGSFNFSTPTFSSAQLGLNLHVAGGFLTNYDGVSATEHGFHLYPENITLTPSAAGGSMGTGTYRYQIVYEWVDGQGQIHRSQPSVVSAAVSVTGPTGSVSVVVPSLRITQKTGTRADVKIVVYRSSSTGGTTVLYRANEADNNPAVDTVTIVDTMVDSNLTDNELLYTVGGVVGNDAPPASRVVHVHGNRVFLAGLEDANVVWFSKEARTHEGLGFSSLFRFTVDATSGGGVQALASLDDKLIIFKTDRIYLLTGEGPLDTSAQNTFSKPVRLPFDVGCSNLTSVVSVPQGIMFKSEKGLKLLTRDLQLIPIGDPVHDYDGEIITSAVLMPEESEVRFTTRAGKALVFNYRVNQWSTFTNYAAESAIAWDNRYLHLKSDGVVNAENETVYTDNGRYVSLRLETSWIQVAGIKGYQRIYWAHILGSRVGNHVLNVQVAYDFDEAFLDNKLFSTDNLDYSYFGSSAFGSASLTLGVSAANVYQCRLKPRWQKCQSIKFVISDSPLASPAEGNVMPTTSAIVDGSGLSLDALVLDVGIKRGSNRLPRDQTV